VKLLVDTSVWSLALRRKDAGSPSPDEQKLKAELVQAIQDGRVVMAFSDYRHVLRVQVVVQRNLYFTAGDIAVQFWRTLCQNDRGIFGGCPPRSSIWHVSIAALL